ncbi:hypothetical protein EON81_13440 [bacterium]|nr:MAG: hypothetical protein EON81_13440 [bacterium]
MMAFRVCAPNGVPGINSSNEGLILNQARLLEEIQDGLAQYNENPDPLVEALSYLITRDKVRIAQAPLGFGDHTEGAKAALQKVLFRSLLFPLRTFDAATGWTKIGLQDARPSDIMATTNAAMIGDAQKVNAQMAKAIFTPRTAGSAGNDSGYEAGFWNGETDVPDNAENPFYGNAHSHYKGTGSSTFSSSMVEDAVEDIVEHGYEGPFVALFNTAQMSDIRASLEASGTMVTPGRQSVIDQGVVNGFEWGGVQYRFKNWVPAGYFAVISLAVQALGRREHELEEYRGLQIFQENENSTAPLIDSQWMRRIDFRVAHMGAGTVRQITPSGTYIPPVFKG